MHASCESPRAALQTAVKRQDHTGVFRLAVASSADSNPRVRWTFGGSYKKKPSQAPSDTSGVGRNTCMVLHWINERLATLPRCLHTGRLMTVPALFISLYTLWCSVCCGACHFHEQPWEIRVVPCVTYR
eukprot:m.636394 g.636394  ORF g.636394 m.636394 type:complete len:129 (-) comp22592_c0_seq5:2393-2779(-)